MLVCLCDRMTVLLDDIHIGGHGFKQFDRVDAKGISKLPDTVQRNVLEFAFDLADECAVNAGRIS